MMHCSPYQNLESEMQAGDRISLGKFADQPIYRVRRLQIWDAKFRLTMSPKSYEQITVHKQ